MTVNGGETGYDQRTDEFRHAVMFELKRQSRIAESTRFLLAWLLAIVVILIALSVLAAFVNS